MNSVENYLIIDQIKVYSFSLKGVIGTKVAIQNLQNITAF